MLPENIDQKVGKGEQSILTIAVGEKLLGSLDIDVSSEQHSSDDSSLPRADVVQGIVEMEEFRGHVPG